MKLQDIGLGLGLGLSLSLSRRLRAGEGMNAIESGANSFDYTRRMTRKRPKMAFDFCGSSLLKVTFGWDQATVRISRDAASFAR